MHKDAVDRTFDCYSHERIVHAVDPWSTLANKGRIYQFEAMCGHHKRYAHGKTMMTYRQTSLGKVNCHHCLNACVLRYGLNTLHLRYIFDPVYSKHIVSGTAVSRIREAIFNVLDAGMAYALQAFLASMAVSQNRSQTFELAGWGKIFCVRKSRNSWYLAPILYTGQHLRGLTRYTEYAGFHIASLDIKFCERAIHNAIQLHLLERVILNDR